METARGKGRKSSFGIAALAVFALLVLAGTALAGRWVVVPGMILLAYAAFIVLENSRRRRHCEFLRCRNREESDE